MIMDNPYMVTEVVRKKLSVNLDDYEFDLIHDRSRYKTGRNEPFADLVRVTDPESDLLYREIASLAVDDCKQFSGSFAEEIDEYARNAPVAVPVKKSGEPLLSVIIPCLNDGPFLLEAIASAEKLDGEHIELIIVDNNSDDKKTVEIINHLEAVGYYVVREPRKGLPMARNSAIKHARGEYLLLLDADNRVFPHYASAALAELNDNHEIDVVYGDMVLFGAKQEEHSQPLIEEERLLMGNVLDAGAVIRRSLWLRIGGFDPAMLTWEDWEFWVNAITNKATFKKIDDVLYCYRVRENSLNSLGKDTNIRSLCYTHVINKHKKAYLCMFERWFAEKSLKKILNTSLMARDCCFLLVLKELLSSRSIDDDELEGIIYKLLKKWEKALLLNKISLGLIR